MRRNQSRICMCILALFLMLNLLAACGVGTNSGTTPISKHAPPTPARPPKGTMLFEADWSHGLTGWQATAGWKVLNGILQSDESDTSTLTVPYRPAVTNYAIEFRARIVKVPSNNAAFGSFLISADAAPGRDGYKAVVIQIPGAGPHPLSVHPQVEVYTEPIDPSNPGTAHDQEFGSQWHVFRVETQENLVNFSIDGQLSGRSASNQTSILSNGPIKLVVSGIMLQVSDFRITVA
jgi:hypothetical protein